MDQIITWQENTWNILSLPTVHDTMPPQHFHTAQKVFDIMHPKGNNNIHPALKRNIVPPLLVSEIGIYSPEDFKRRFNEKFQNYIDEDSETNEYWDHEKVILQLISQYYQQIKTVPVNEYRAYSEHIEECGVLVLQIYSRICRKLGITPKDSLDQVTWERVIDAIDILADTRTKQREVSDFILQLQNTDIPLHPQRLYEMIERIREYIDTKNNIDREDTLDWQEIWTYHMLQVCQDIQTYIDSHEVDPNVFEWQSELVWAFRLDPEAENIWIEIWRKAAKYNHHRTQTKRAPM